MLSRIIPEFVLPCGKTLTREMHVSDLVHLLPCFKFHIKAADLYAETRCAILREKIRTGQVNVALATFGLGSDHDLLVEEGYRARSDYLDEVYHHIESEMRRRYVNRAENIKTGKKLVSLDPVLSVLFLDEDYDFHDELFGESNDETDCPCENMGASCTSCHIRLAG